MTRRVPALALLLLAPAVLVAQATAAPPASYTDEQAQRGAKTFARACGECHATAEMANADFRLKWHGRPAFDLFSLIATTMPEENPGTLTREEYAEIVAYLMKLNGAPTGALPLPADSAALSRAALVIGPTPPRR
jgi:mono/diheme cytochrome c family protein